MRSENIVELKEISKVYERKIALSSLSLTIKTGELVALIGPSGAGKTTLLNIISNSLKPDSGEIFLEDKTLEEFKSVKDLAKKIGIIRQQFDLVRELPVIQNVLVGRLSHWGFLKSMISLIFPQDKEMALKALSRVGLLDKAYERTSNLSGGEQQRVALARLLVQKPEIILADEPVASLDPARSEDILAILTTLAKEDEETLIASLHTVEYAKKYFHRIIALKEGQLYFDLPSEAVTDEALSKLYELKELD